jgi:hypothetical protein
MNSTDILEHPANYTCKSVDKCLYQRPAMFRVAQMFEMFEMCSRHLGLFRQASVPQNTVSFHFHSLNFFTLIMATNNRKSQKVHPTTKTSKNRKPSSPSSRPHRPRPPTTRRRCPTSQQLSNQLTDSESTTSDTAVQRDASTAVAEKKAGKAAAQQRWYQK